MASIARAMFLGLPAAAALFSASAHRFIDSEDFERYMLQGKLFADAAAEIECIPIGFVHRPELDFDMFGGELRKCLAQLSVEKEREVGIELLLELKELELFT